MAVGQTQSERARAGPNEQAVAVPVIATGEFDDFRPAGVSTRKAQRRYSRFGARRSQPQLFDGGDRLDEGSGQFDLAGGRCAETRSLRHDLAEGLDDRPRGVPGDQRAPRADVVDVLAPVRIDDPTAEPPLDEQRFPAHGQPRPHRAVHTARNVALRLKEELLRGGHARPLQSPARKRVKRNRTGRGDFLCVSGELYAGRGPSSDECNEL